MTLKFPGKIKYQLLAIIFLILSLVSTLYLVKLKQDIRNKATPLCLTDTRCGNVCDMVYCSSCINGCRLATYKSCNQWIAEECGPQNNQWTNCTTGDGLTVTNRCVTASGLDASLSLCPGTFPSNGCNDPNFTKNTSGTLCFKDNFCGAQQIDVWSPKQCWVHVEDRTSCTSPTPTEKPTSTPTRVPTLTPTRIPTSTPTGTIIPSLTPTNTPIPSTTPTGTLAPTNTPTNTPPPTGGPTNTIVPTDVLAQAPSPTRIILPSAGVEFPSQIIGIVGVIVTLVGFLILL